MGFDDWRLGPSLIPILDIEQKKIIKNINNFSINNKFIYIIKIYRKKNDI